MTNLDKTKELIINKIKSSKTFTDLEHTIKMLSKLHIKYSSGINELVSTWLYSYDDDMLDVWGQAEFKEATKYFIYQLIPHLEILYLETTNSDYSYCTITPIKDKRLETYTYEEAQKIKNELNRINQKQMTSWSIGKVGADYDV